VVRLICDLRRLVAPISICVLCWPSVAAAVSLAAGDHVIHLIHQQRERSYIVHIPPQVTQGRALAVILNFHGGGGNAADHQAYTHMDRVADLHGFVAVYPQGTGKLEHHFLTWNAGPCCGYAHAHNIDDVDFTRAILKDLASRVAIDRSRIYATGLSNGALMSYRLAMDAPDVITAIAPVAGSLRVPKPEIVKPVSILHIHSVDDPRALYDGGLGPPFPFTNLRVDHPAVETMLGAWARIDGCQTTPRILDRRAYASPDRRQHAELLDFPGCKSHGLQLRLWRIHGAGHVWPGGEQDYLARILGPGTRVINASEAMWQFFQGLEHHQ
jgi:polyhydroxybutyrate depolymerase